MLSLNYDGWCRRIDLHFRAKYPHIKTKLYKINEYDYQIEILSEVDDFKSVLADFDHAIKYITAPVYLVESTPPFFEKEIEGIDDKNIPSKFEGFPLTKFDIFNHVSCLNSDLKVSKIETNHEEKSINVKLVGHVSTERKRELTKTLGQLKYPFSFKVSDGGCDFIGLVPENEVLTITSSQSQGKLNCDFIERDEVLWFSNVESIYNGSFNKNDLYFIEPGKTSCLVNFSKFKNANIRNHLLLYDVVYCELPLLENMGEFLSEQQISKDEILTLIENGRLKILNTQPEARLDYGFLNEAHQTNTNSVVSRRALSALCAIDLVSINQSYILSNAEVDIDVCRLIRELALITNTDINLLAKFMLWPKYALRHSFNALNQAGPMGISSYGVNNPISDVLPSLDKDKIGFEFLVNSDQIHLAHALDSTYFPFFTDGSKYTDHPYAMMMGDMLNFYKTTSLESLSHIFQSDYSPRVNNRTISLISAFDINNYIPVSEFEQEISSSVIRNGMNSLFSELHLLAEDERNERISMYNYEVTQALKNKNVSKHALDLGEDAMGLMVPFFATGAKLLKTGTRKAIDKFPSVRQFSEFIEDKTQKRDQISRNVSILSKVNRVARLKKDYT